VAGTAASFSTSEPVRLDDTLWEIPAGARGDMRVPARVFADRELLDAIMRDRSLEQLENVATLPGIVEAALAMPDIHQGYGFPVGGVAAMELPDGVVSPGGVGYDINCGVRLLALPLTEPELGDRRVALVHELMRAIPSGAGKHGPLALSGPELDDVLRTGPRALLRRGIGHEDDIERTESQGCLPGADPRLVSARAHERGAGQLGTVGSGNHFIELQRVEHVFDEVAAEAYGLCELQVTVLIHSGSRGLGHQVCADHVRLMDAVGARFGIELPDRQRTGLLARGPGLSRRDGGGCELRLRQPAGARPRGPRRSRPDPRRRRRRGNPSGLRRRPQRGQGRTARRARAARPSQGRHARVPGRLGRDPGRLSGGGAAGVHSRQHGHGELRARR
jgi:tRNA-splicing ligase RtcB (3'-phosphate/5'-hydroxy nucleic acid ligase)